MTRRDRGFSITEVMVVVAILGILSALMIDIGLRDWRREQVNAVVVELAGWLESVRRAALKGSSCQVTLTTGNAMAGGAVLAEAADVGTADTAASTIANNCRSLQSLVIPGLNTNQTFTVTASNTTGSFVFTPAGTLHPAPGATTPIVITVELANGSNQDPRRCVELEGLLGVIHVGRAIGDNACNTTSDRF